MKKKDLSIGLEVVLSDDPKAPIYVVTELSEKHPFSAQLGYTTTAGMRVNSGWHDVSIMQLPTIGQQEANGNI